jgi:uncharacterized SAM-binding protein YcdF (DUF218 family)
VIRKHCDPQAEAIVVLGCRGAAALRRRVALGVRLWQDGAAPVLLLSGGGDGPEPEAELMRREALAAGVPESALLVEARSRDTLGNARECARLLGARGLCRIILVSDRVHLPRAALLFRRAGLDIVARAGTPAPPGAWVHEAASWPKSLWRLCFFRRRRR